MDQLYNVLQFALAGAWASVWHWGLGIGLIILLLAGAYFTTAIPLIGPYLTGLRKDLCWAAFAVGVLMAGEYIGDRDGDARCKAKAVVVEKVVTKAVAATKTNRARRSSDPWNNPSN